MRVGVEIGKMVAVKSARYLIKKNKKNKKKIKKKLIKFNKIK